MRYYITWNYIVSVFTQLIFSLNLIQIWVFTESIRILASIDDIFMLWGQ